MEKFANDSIPTKSTINRFIVSSFQTDVNTHQDFESCEYESQRLNLTWPPNFFYHCGVFLHKEQKLEDDCLLGYCTVQCFHQQVSSP
jgi:hypothetical protein